LSLSTWCCAVLLAAAPSAQAGPELARVRAADTPQSGPELARDRAADTRQLGSERETASEPAPGPPRAADAPWLAPPPVAESAPAPALLPQGRRNYVIPALETAIFNLGLLAFNNLALQQEFARVRIEDLGAHLDGSDGWTFDVDHFPINQVGHPYQGVLAFTAARSSGLPFWTSGLYAAGSSLAWELFFERDPPSINDQITTTLGGIFLGEALHRSFRILVDAEGREPVLNRVVATVISPVSSFNHWLLNDEMDRHDLDRAAGHLAVFELGGTLSTNIRSSPDGESFFNQGPQLFFGADLMSGLPYEDWTDREPFAHYAVSLDVAVPRTPLVNLFVRGLLVGGGYGTRRGGARGLFGLFGLYDLSANHDVRMSSVGLGFGTTAQLPLGGDYQLLVSGILGGIGMGAAGSLGLYMPLTRDYLIGPGVQGITEAALIHPRLGHLALRTRSWRIFGVYAAPRGGSEWVTYSSLELRAKVASRLALGLDLPLMTRAFDHGRAAGQSDILIGANPRLVLSIHSEEGFLPPGLP
jgi:hypothetical protein